MNIINNLVIMILIISRIEKTKASLTLTRGTPDIIVEGIKCEGPTLNNIPSFGCLCKREVDTFYEYKGKYCYSLQQILEIEGKPFSILLF